MENSDIAFLAIKFFDTWTFPKHWSFPPGIFLALSDKKIHKTLMSPLFYMKVFETRFFLKRRNVPLRILPALWDKNFSMENSNIAFLGIKLLDSRTFLKQALRDNKNSTIPRCHPPSFARKTWLTARKQDSSFNFTKFRGLKSQNSKLYAFPFSFATRPT